MLYSEFLEATKAVNNQATFEEYKRVEEIYMVADKMTKEDAYRMAKVETEEQHEARMEAERKKEMTWVMNNIIPAAAFIRGMSEKRHHLLLGKNFIYKSPCWNSFELKLVRDINGGSVMLYEFWVNERKIDISSTGYNLLPSAEFQTYRADWHDKSPKELEDLFGFIA